MRGELASPPRLKNPKLPKTISDIVMKAIAADVSARYQRASDLLDAVLSASRTSPPKRPWRASPMSGGSAAVDEAQEIQTRLKARETVQPRFCWKCGKALHARTDSCPFCGEPQ
jgi:hypothetical protein